MIKLIVGPKGAGKTKTMIDMINAAVKTTEGNIVVIEKSMKLTTDINHAARLLDVDEYGIQGADMLYGFVAGVLAGNYDITELFLDGLLKIVDHDMDAAAALLASWTPSPRTWRSSSPSPPPRMRCRTASRSIPTPDFCRRGGAAKAPNDPSLTAKGRGRQARPFLRCP